MNEEHVVVANDNRMHRCSLSIMVGTHVALFLLGKVYFTSVLYYPRKGMP